MLQCRNVKFADVQDWDDLVKQTYGRPYSLQQQDGCMSRGIVVLQVPQKHADDFTNDSIPEKINGKKRGVSFQAWLNRDPKAPVGNESKDYAIELFWERNFYPEVETLANDLYNKGLIEAGEYIINIDW